jgi:Holliday junction resolvase
MDNIAVLTEHPLPTDVDGITQLQQASIDRENGYIQSDDEVITSVEQFHDIWITELVWTDEWAIFTCEWESMSGWIYVWNHRSEYGFKFRDNTETARALVEAFEQFASESDKHDSHKKGDRNERQARRILKRKYTAERVPSIYGNNDPFRLADVMGIAHGLPFMIVQVKTNNFTKKDREYYKKWAKRRVDGEHTLFEVWVRIDRKGWKMYRLDPETWEYNCYFETSRCDPSDMREEWADTFEQLTVQ